MHDEGLVKLFPAAENIKIFLIFKCEKFKVIWNPLIMTINC